MSFPSGGIAPIAQAQLAAWQALAADWATYPDGPCRRCASCGQAVYRIKDDHGSAYQYRDGEILALAVAHLRQAHPDLDPDRVTR